MRVLLAIIASVLSMQVVQAEPVQVESIQLRSVPMGSIQQSARRIADFGFVEAHTTEGSVRPAWGMVVDFGFVKVHMSEYRALRFENNSEEEITNIEMSITGSSAFGGVTSCKDTLAAGETCDIHLDFVPWYQGSFFGGFHIQSDNFDEDISLRGWGEWRQP